MMGLTSVAVCGVVPVAANIVPVLSAAAYRTGTISRATTTAGNIMIDHYFKGLQKKSKVELNQEYENLEKRIVKRFFVMPHLPVTFLIENFPKQFSWNSGWNIMSFEMNFNTEVKHVENKNLEDFILKAPRTEQELFQVTSSSVNFVQDDESESSKIINYFVSFLLLFMLSN